MRLPVLLSTAHVSHAFGSTVTVPGLMGSKRMYKFNAVNKFTVCSTILKKLNVTIQALITRNMSVDSGLTFTFVHSLGPRVLKFVVTRISTLPEPSTTSNTATLLAFGVGAALGTPAPFDCRLERWSHTIWDFVV